ncbi:hypothetical protein SLEP1_g27411 [Rubroshorea leprosula]|uniref:Uncharacterized protein n=1 Tax=Rubroshorea leprosula TaxID=152421 RepID=A0AAV5JQG8_9ROSI|nr:hypothetical protein SLEP1_g27411 [Rubroshorea leprosula]
MASTAMEQSPYGSRRDEPDFNLREWAVKARISRENTSSRRYSASYVRSIREDTRSFRSNITISSTASSPGYPLKDEIDPSTYSFTTALKALQARSAYNCWECLSPDGFSLNSKWNEAEKYICNPLSGEFPMECLSAKTLSGRSFRSLTSRITMSAPLMYSHSRHIQTKPSRTVPEDVSEFPTLCVEGKKKKVVGMTRDVGTQSTPPDLSSSSPSPTSTPSIPERSLKRCGTENGDSPNSNAKSKAEDQVETKEPREQEEETKTESEERRKREKQLCYRCNKQGGCFSWMRKRQREKQKSRKMNFFLPHFKRRLKGELKMEKNIEGDEGGYSI